jgi:hypothetical protein
MIIYSPHTKFTMQRISDHVANGAYFYFKIEYDSTKTAVNTLIEKLTHRYELGLSPRQRSYRLEKGNPICTVIVQRDVFNEHKWSLYCLFTTPKSRDFNSYNGIEVSKLAKLSERVKVEELQKKYADFKWDLDSISTEIELIANYFKDNEPKLFALKNPIAVKPTALVTLELIRDGHKSYKQLVLGDEKEYKDRVRTYTWTWRYSQKSVEQIKKKFVDTIHKLVSQKTTTSAERNRADLKNLFLLVETWSVFKASRSQAGQILHFAHRFLQKRAKRTWNQINMAVPHLTYLPRLSNYANTLYEYGYRRDLFDEYGIEVPLTLIQDYFKDHNNMMITSYIFKELEKRKNSDAIFQKADEYHLKILE